jgi:hypothetical protein
MRQKSFFQSQMKVQKMATQPVNPMTTNQFKKLTTPVFAQE